MKWGRGLLPGVGASSSLAPAHTLVPPALRAGGSPLLTYLLLLPPSNGNLLTAAPGAEEESHSGGTPPCSPLKLMAITEELTKGTAMVAVTRALLQEHSRSTWGKKAEQCLQGTELVEAGNGDSLSPVSYRTGASQAVQGFCLFPPEAWQEETLSLKM